VRAGKLFSKSREYPMCTCLLIRHMEYVLGEKPTGDLLE
jgi:hypothetical protein